MPVGEWIWRSSDSSQSFDFIYRCFHITTYLRIIEFFQLHCLVLWSMQVVHVGELTFAIPTPGSGRQWMIIRQMNWMACAWRVSGWIVVESTLTTSLVLPRIAILYWQKCCKTCPIWVTCRSDVHKQMTSTKWSWWSSGKVGKRSGQSIPFWPGCWSALFSH